MKRVLGVLCGLGILWAIGCSPIPIEAQSTGDVEVSVSQALHDVDGIDRIVVEAYFGEGPDRVLNGTYELGFNGSKWTALLEGLPEGNIFLKAKAYVGDVLVFESDEVKVIVKAKQTATATIVLHQVGEKEGIKAPVIKSITTDQSAVRPGESVNIQVCVFDLDESVVELCPTSENAGGTFNPNTCQTVTLVNKKGCASIAWKAPTERGPTLPVPEHIELEVRDSTGASLRVQLFLRVIWENSKAQINFELNLAPAVTRLAVTPVNPVDGQGGPVTTLLGGALKLSFTAYDPDAEGDETLRYRWYIPEECGATWEFVWELPPWERIDPAGELGTGNDEYTVTHRLHFAVDPPLHCVLKLEVTDGEGLSTWSFVTLSPFDLVTKYTPTLEMQLQNGDQAVPGNTLDFGVVSFERIYTDYYQVAPKFYWQLGNGAGFNLVPTSEIKTRISLEGVAYISTFRWVVSEVDKVPCTIDDKVIVTAMACNPVHLDDNGNELCSDPVEFTVNVPEPDAICQ